MKQKLENMPLFNKLFIFSFMIAILVVVSIIGSSFYLQSKQLKSQITERAQGVATLWSATISPEDIHHSAKLRQLDHPSMVRLVERLTMVNERNSSLLNGFLVLPEEYPGGKVFVLAAADSYQLESFKSLVYYKAGEEFLTAFNQAKGKGTFQSTDIYKDQYGTWITTFEPIIDEKGEIAAILGIDADASMLRKNQSEMLFILLMEMAVIILGVYFVLNWGLKRGLKPVNDMFFGIKEISTGNFSVRLPVEDQSELGQLSDRFNEMAEQLSQLFERVSAASRQLGQTAIPVSESMPLEEAIDRMEDIFQKAKLQQELQRAEKMNAIGQLAASVAHEIRNPMTVVKGFLQIFLAKDLPDEERMYIKLMIEELNRAETIINDYLSLAKPDIGKLEVIESRDLAEKVMDLMVSYAMLSKNISIHTEIKDDIKVKGNKNELKQVLINILKNGIEAMNDGGRLTLIIEKQEEFGVFRVIDTGIGMTDEELTRLGTAFYSLKERGTGMGLMVCYQIVERMKGHIKVTSKKGVGTTFEIFVPIMSEPRTK
ncbi:HAMP domain-containing sensor histidine kinase [Bacillus sp. REN3]|uniref:sensor histidine kinase n=1 Tax=Bacillus sp. REN3 TaxID=2802440 RepID=UPI001AED9644|nr:HAMP domain-containing sensor histidine kinase [Bacillus sp. REN3]